MALGLIGIQTAKCSVVQVFVFPEAHELTEVVYGGRFELVTGCQKRIAMREAIRAVVPLLDFFLAWAGLDSLR